MHKPARSKGGTRTVMMNVPPLLRAGLCILGFAHMQCGEACLDVASKNDLGGGSASDKGVVAGIEPAPGSREASYVEASLAAVRMRQSRRNLLGHYRKSRAFPQIERPSRRILAG